MSRFGQAYFRQRAAPPSPEAADWRHAFAANDGVSRLIARLCFGLGVSIAFVAPALAELAMTGAPVTMRGAPTARAGLVQRIPQSAEIELIRCARGWCRASWRGRFGYIPEEAVVLGPPPATLPGDEMPPPFINAQPTYVTPPVWTWTGPYVGVRGGFGSGAW